MSNKFHLLVQTQDGNEHQLQYQSADNPIANDWIKKMKHISKLPFDQIYTSKNDVKIPKELLNSDIAKDIELLNATDIGKIYEVKSEYNQNDCNRLHSFTVKHQYEYNLEVRNIFHRLHRRIHLLEDILSGADYKISWLFAEWGESGGLLTTTHKQSPYDYYELKMFAGNLYHRWTEFGKSPYTYWKNKDIEDETHFINNCKPHVTFRPGFALCINNIGDSYRDKDFELWFKKYEKIWKEKYNLPDLSAYEHGGVLLAEPMKDYSDIFANMYTIKSIELDYLL